MQQAQPRTTGARPLEKKVKVPLKISPIHQTAVEMADDYKRIGDDVVVITIQAKDYVKTLVVHEPIGVTPLAPGSWVIDQLANIETLLVAEKDPSSARKQEARTQLRSAVLVTGGFLKIEGDKTVLASGPDKGKTQNEVLKTAETAAKDQHTLAYEAYVASVSTGRALPKKEWPTPIPDPRSFLNVETRTLFDKMQEYLKTNKTYQDGLKRIEPKPYETLGGPNNTIRQERVAFSAGRTYSRQQVVDAFAAHLLRAARLTPFPNIGGEGADPVRAVEELLNPTPGPAPPAPTGTGGRGSATGQQG